MTKPSRAKGEAKQKDRFRAVRREMRVKQSIVLLFCALVTYWFLFDAGPGHAWFLEHVVPHVSTILAIVLQLIMGLAMMILQFIGLMWFLAGAKVTWIMPGEATAKSLDDYIGQPIVLRQLREIVDILNGASKIVAMGGRPPIGGLVAGPPGSGKTYAAKCIGGSAMCPVGLIEGGRLRSMWFGVGSLKVISFVGGGIKRAKRSPTKSCLLFMDELDTIGQARSGVEGAAGQGRMPMFGMGAMGILNTLLSQISGLHDGYPGWKGRLFKRLWKIYQGLHELVGEEPPPLPAPDWFVMFLGSTNRPDSLDTALVRPGRLGDKKIYIGNPDRTGLEEIVRYYIARVDHEDDINIGQVALAIQGAAPADVEAAVMCAAPSRAVQDGRDKICTADVIMGFLQGYLGTEKPLARHHPWDRAGTATHEGAHALACQAFFPEMMPVLATCLPHMGGRIGSFLGVMIPRFHEERVKVPMSFVWRSMIMSRAGQVGADMVMGVRTMGFMGDRRNMQSALNALVAETAFGLSASLFYQAPQMSMVGMSGGGLQQIPKELRATIVAAIERVEADTRLFLEANLDTLRRLASVLYEEGTVTADMFLEFFADHPVAMPDELARRWADPTGMTEDEVLALLEVSK